jgi:hypothetical protein
MFTKTKLKKIARETVLDPKEHPVLKVILEMCDDEYCMKRVVEELQTPKPDMSVAFNLLLAAIAMRSD